MAMSHATLWTMARGDSDDDGDADDDKALATGECVMACCASDGDAAELAADPARACAAHDAEDLEDVSCIVHVLSGAVRRRVTET